MRRILITAALTAALPAAAHDNDGDGIDSLAVPPDNCPNVSNVGQVDTDGDGAGDACADPRALAAGPFGGTWLGAKSSIADGSSADAGTVIGRRTTVGAVTSIGTNGTIGRAVTIGDNNTIGNGVTVGYAGQIGSGVQVGDASHIGNLAVAGDGSTFNGAVRLGRAATTLGATITDATIGPDATVAAGAVVQTAVHIRRGATVHRAATLNAGATIGRGAIIGEGATVTAGTIVRAGATVHSFTTASADVPRGASVGVPNQIRTIDVTDGVANEYGAPICSDGTRSVYFAADDAYFYFAVEGEFLGGGASSGPFFSFVLHNADGNAGTYWAYDFPNAGTGDGWTYGVTIFDNNNICYAPYTDGICQQVGFDPSFAHFAGKVGVGNTTEVRIPRLWLGSTNGGSGMASFGVFIHSTSGPDHQIQLACDTANPTGFSANTAKAQWTTWATAPYPSLLP